MTNSGIPKFGDDPLLAKAITSDDGQFTMHGAGDPEMDPEAEFRVTLSVLDVACIQSTLATACEALEARIPEEARLTMSGGFKGIDASKLDKESRTVLAVLALTAQTLHRLVEETEGLYHIDSDGQGNLIIGMKPYEPPKAD